MMVLLTKFMDGMILIRKMNLGMKVGRTTLGNRVLQGNLVENDVNSRDVGEGRCIVLGIKVMARL